MCTRYVPINQSCDETNSLTRRRPEAREAFLTWPDLAQNQPTISASYPKPHRPDNRTLALPFPFPRSNTHRRERAREDGVPGAARRGPTVPPSIRRVAPSPRGAEAASVGACVRYLCADQGRAGAGADAPGVRRRLRALPHRAHGGRRLLPRRPRHRRRVHRHRHGDRLARNPSIPPLLYCH
jgi:hypothetical protein